MRNLAILAFLFSGLGMVCAQAPKLFYSDLTSGPASGGEGGTNGAYVCVYGENFGSSQGESTISVGGVAASAYKVWSDGGSPYLPGHYAKACFQVAAATPSGADLMEMTTSAATSGTLPFTVESGNIYFVSTSGNDSTGTGSSTSPWRTTAKCMAAMAPGNICYIENGIVESTCQGSSSGVVNYGVSGTSGDPVAVGAYPGATIEAIANSCGERGITDYVSPGTVSNIVIFGWTAIGDYSGTNGGIELAESGGSYDRLIDNTIECYGGGCDGQGAGLEASNHDYMYVYGNRIESVGCHEDFPTYSSSAYPCNWQAPSTTISCSGTSCTLSAYTSNFAVGDVIENTADNELREIIAQPTGGVYVYTLDSAFTTAPTGTGWEFRDFVPDKEFHNVYFSTQTDHVWFAWNEVDGSEGHAFRGVQFNSTGGNNQYDLHVFNNYIHDTQGDCINFAIVDPSSGPVEAYNNILRDCGIEQWWYSPPSYGGQSCVYVANQYSTGYSGGSGTVEVYDNTCYGAGYTAKCQTGGAFANSGSQGLADIGYSSEYQSANERTRFRDNLFITGGNSSTGSGSATAQDYLTPATVSYGLPYLCQAGTVDPYCTGQSTNNDWYGSSASAQTYTANNLYSNPLWVNASANDFHLQSGSPAIGTGVAAATTDADGNARANPPSLGALEYTTSGSTGGALTRGYVSGGVIK